MKAVILAGGKGQRMNPLSLTKPKSMLYIGREPLIHHVVKHLASQGFGEIITTIGYKQEQITSFLGSGQRYGVKMTHVSEGKRALGTAGSVKLAEKLLDEPFLVIQGDAVTNVNLSSFVERHLEAGATASIGLKEVETPSSYGVLVLRSDGSVKELIEKPKDKIPSKLINTGIYFLNPDSLDYIPDGKPYDFAKDFFPMLLNKTAPVFGFPLDGFWIDAGEKDGYLQANSWYLRNMHRNISPESTVKGEVRGNVHVGRNVMIDSGSTVANPSMIDEAVSVGRGSRIGPDVILMKNTKAGKNVRILASSVYEDCEIGDDVLIESSVIAEKCKIEKNVEIHDAMIGASCKIGKNAKILSGSMIYPGITIKAGQTVNQTIQ
ncbi:MAG: NDP-sugar synthase [Thaumarchaeota archaeon]|nr:NDP-sugar synthase [Nitrososphaerota archaeon]